MISIIIVQWSVDITTNMSSYFFLRSWWIWVCCLVVTLCICISGKSCGTSCLWGGFKFLLMFFWYLSIQQKFIKPQPPRRKHYFQILSEKKLNCTMKVQLDGHWCIWEVMDHLKKMKINLKTIYWRRVFQS